MLKKRSIRASNTVVSSQQNALLASQTFDKTVPTTLRAGGAPTSYYSSPLATQEAQWYQMASTSMYTPQMTSQGLHYGVPYGTPMTLQTSDSSRDEESLSDLSSGTVSSHPHSPHTHDGVVNHHPYLSSAHPMMTTHDGSAYTAMPGKPSTSSYGMLDSHSVTSPQQNQLLSLHQLQPPHTQHFPHHQHHYQSSIGAWANSVPPANEFAQQPAAGQAMGTLSLDSQHYADGSMATWSGTNRGAHPAYNMGNMTLRPQPQESQNQFSSMQQQQQQLQHQQQAQQQARRQHLQTPTTPQQGYPGTHHFQQEHSHNLFAIEQSGHQTF